MIRPFLLYRDYCDCNVYCYHHFYFEYEFTLHIPIHDSPSYEDPVKEPPES